MINLLQKLTTKEKIGQLLQIAPFFFIKDLEKEVYGPLLDLQLNEEKIFLAGSVLGIGSATEMMEVQKQYLKKSKHQIPLLFMADIIHGYKTIFPVPLALASSWNPELVKKAARISAVEASTAGIHVTFAPMADLSRDPRWGRVVEGFGEDPYLTGVMAQSMVEGFQNDGIEKDGNLAACVKHFAGYGASEAGRDYNTVDVSRYALHNYYFEGYKKAIDAGAKLIMTAFNVIEGVPSTTNRFLLRDILRDQWKFKGVTISDYDSLKQTIAHGQAKDMEEAALNGIDAGLDIEMASSCYTNHLEKLIVSGQVDMKLLDEAVLRILELKKEIGLFENPYKGASLEQEEKLVLSKKHLAESLKVAHESAVLLKNEDVLPLDKQTKVALIGPFASSRKTQGSWSWHGRHENNQTLIEVFNLEKADVVYINDEVDALKYTKKDLEQLKTADVILVLVGEDEKWSGEAHSLSDLHLRDGQHLLVELAKSLNKKVVTVLFNGRPLVLTNISQSDAILEAWFLGTRSAQAVYDLLYGRVNPSGKLTMSFPVNVGQIPIYYNHLNTGRPLEFAENPNTYVSRYLDVGNDPLYPFGYGLSYSKFSYDPLELNSTTLQKEDALEVKVTIQNKSDVDGYEVVQLYIRDHHAKVVRPVQELKQFQKIWIPKRQKRSLTFKLTQTDLSYHLPNGDLVVEPGLFTVMVGSSAHHVEKIQFELKEDN